MSSLGYPSLLITCGANTPSSKNDPGECRRYRPSGEGHRVYGQVNASAKCVWKLNTRPPIFSNARASEGVDRMSDRRHYNILIGDGLRTMAAQRERPVAAVMTGLTVIIAVAIALFAGMFNV